MGEFFVLSFRFLFELEWRGGVERERRYRWQSIQNKSIDDITLQSFKINTYELAL